MWLAALIVVAAIAALYAGMWWLWISPATFPVKLALAIMIGVAGLSAARCVQLLW